MTPQQVEDAHRSNVKAITYSHRLKTCLLCGRQQSEGQFMDSSMQPVFKYCRNCRLYKRRNK